MEGIDEEAKQAMRSSFSSSITQQMHPSNDATAQIGRYLPLSSPLFSFSILSQFFFQEEEKDDFFAVVLRLVLRSTTCTFLYFFILPTTLHPFVQ